MSIDLPVTAGVDEPRDTWFARHRSDLEELLLRHGAVLVTGGAVTRPEEVAAVRAALDWPVAACRDRIAPRTEPAPGVYSWPEWGADRDMCWHHEQSQGATFPARLVLARLAAPARGGAVLLSDTREVLRRLPDRLRSRFREQGWRLHRSFHPYLGTPWAETFGTSDVRELEARLAAEQVEASWDGGVLRTRQHRRAVVAHPVTGDECWFNDVAFFSQWSVAPVERNVMLDALGPDALPANTYFGDGSPLDEGEYDALTDAHSAAGLRLEFRPGDVLLIDNVLTAHGRESYAGDWDIAVAPAHPTAATPVSS